MTGTIPEHTWEQGETVFMKLGVMVAKYHRKLIAEGTPDTLAHDLAVSFQVSLFEMIGQNLGGQDE